VSAETSRRESHAVILLLAGGTLLRIAISGDFQRYVKVGLRPYLLVSGAVIVTLALLSLLQSLPKAPLIMWLVAHSTACRPPDPMIDEDGHAHSHGHGRFDVGWLLVVPMAVLLFVGPPAIGAFAASRSGTALTAAPDSPYPPIPAGDPVTMSVIDFASRAVFDSTHSLAGRHVALTGFLTKAPGGGFYLTRMVVTCCAADAQPIKVGLSGTLPSGAGSDAWVAVTGHLGTQTAKDPVNGAKIPFLVVTSAIATTVPSQPYES